MFGKSGSDTLDLIFEPESGSFEDVFYGSKL